MKIVFLTTHLNTGGITSYLLTLTREYLRRGHKVFVVSDGGDMAETFTSSGAVWRPLGFRTKSELNPRLYTALPSLSRWLSAEGVDILHAQTRVTQVMASALSRMTRIPAVSTCHGFFRPRLFRRLWPLWGEAVIAISPAVEQHLRDDFRVPSTDIHLIRNGVAAEDFPEMDEAARASARRSLGIPDGPLLGIIARLSEVKGHAVLIEAMPHLLKKVPEARLMIVGEGRTESALRAQVDLLGLGERIRFYPIVNRTADLLPLLNVFVMPSLQEGLGLSVMEAQAAGRPVVASRVGGLPSLIEHGRTGLLVPPRNPEALAEAVADLLSRPDEAAAMGRAARDFIRREFSSAVMADQTLDVYTQVLNRRVT